LTDVFFVSFAFAVPCESQDLSFSHKASKPQGEDGIVGFLKRTPSAPISKDWGDEKLENRAVSHSQGLMIQHLLEILDSLGSPNNVFDLPQSPGITNLIDLSEQFETAFPKLDLQQRRYSFY